LHLELPAAQIERPTLLAEKVLSPDHPYRIAREAAKRRAAARPRPPDGLPGLIRAIDDLLLLMDHIQPVAAAIENGETAPKSAAPVSPIQNNASPSRDGADERPQTIEKEAPSTEVFAIEEPSARQVQPAGFELEEAAPADGTLGSNSPSSPEQPDAVAHPVTPAQRDKIAASLVSFHRDMVIPRVAPFILKEQGTHPAPADEGAGGVDDPTSQR
jgi:hypothetical protein